MLKVIKFTAPWCGMCKAYAREFIKAIKGAEEDNLEVTFEEVDVSDDNYDNHHNIQGLPTTIIEKDGIEVDRLPGIKKSEDILNTVRKYGNFNLDKN